MAGLFSRVKIWGPSETVTNTDLNAEFNNILANVDSSHAQGYSGNLSEMQSTSDPGAVGAENLVQPLSITDEIKRLRFTIGRIVGKSPWYASPSTNLETLQSNLSQAFYIAPQRVISGKKSANSSQPVYLQALGAGGISIQASSAVPFSAYIDSNLITLTSNVVLTGVSAAPSTSNTATLLDTFQASQFSKGIQTFNLSSPGTEITARAGKLSAFKINNGTNTEYFTGTVTSGPYTTYAVVSGTTTPTTTTVTKIVGIQRGSLFDSTGVPSLPVTLTTGHTITVLRMTYVFLTSSSTLDVTYNPLSYQGTAPTGASIGDYWYDTVNTTWKRYGGSTWTVANAILVGICAQDGANTVFSRSVDFYNQYSAINTLLPTSVTPTTVAGPYLPAASLISVYGKTITRKGGGFNWDITSQLVAGESESANTLYYLYVKETGDVCITSQKPLLDRERQGYYHPYETWRAVGSVFNNSNSDFDATTIEAFSSDYGQHSEYLEQWDVWPSATVGSLVPHAGLNSPRNRVNAIGTNYSINQLPRLFLVTGIAHGQSAGSGTFNVIDMRGFFLRGLTQGTTQDPDAGTRGSNAFGGFQGNAVGSIQSDAMQTHKHNTTANGGAGAAFGNGPSTTTGAYANQSSGGNALTDVPITPARITSETRPVNVAVNFVVVF